MNEKVIIGIPFFNEQQQMPILLNNLKKIARQKKYYFLFIDDCSTDNTPFLLKKFMKNYSNIKLISNPKNLGIGNAIKKIITYAIKNKYNICVIMAGNGKDNPVEIKNMVEPITQKGYDYVQGSRFLKGGSFNNLPFIRKLLIKGFTFLAFISTGRRLTDASNGFRAYKLSIFKDAGININQSWLDRYEFETFLHYKVMTRGYKVCEIPVSKNYIPGVKNYSKIRPLFDWWRMVKPLVYLKLRIKN